MLTICNPLKLEEDPMVIVCTSETGQPYNSENRKYNGKLARVRPITGEDVRLIQLMRHQIDYFAPTSGDGLLVNPDLLKR
jgi:hypothetical protein